MVEEKEEMLQKLNRVKQTAEEYLAANNFENYVVKDVVRYNKEVELTPKDSEENETKKFHLYVVDLENTDPEKAKEEGKEEGEEEDELKQLIYLEDEEGNLYTIADLIQEYEGCFEKITEVIEETKANEEKPEEERDPEYTKYSLTELEEEKEKEGLEEKEGEEKQKEGNEEPSKKKNQREPKYIIQTIDANSYFDNIETIHRAFRLPSNVTQLAFAYPNKEDKRELGRGVTLYMLDENGNIVDGAEKYFKIDDATGKNPFDDKSTDLELDGTGERHEGKTMRRFRSTQRPDRYLSVKQKEVGQYNEVYADSKEETENSSIGNQVETRNVEIQTSLEMQTINSTYKGLFNPDEIGEEIDKHEEHGDDLGKIAKANLDGKEHTHAPCEKNIYLLYECVIEIQENDYIRENFSDEEIIKKLISIIDRNPKITREQLIEATKQSCLVNQKVEEQPEEDLGMYREGPWDSAKH